MFGQLEAAARANDNEKAEKERLRGQQGRGRAQVRARGQGRGRPGLVEGGRGGSSRSAAVPETSETQVRHHF